MTTTEGPAALNTSGDPEKDTPTNLSTQYDTPMGLAHSTMATLKERITLHYDLASDYYLNLWYVSTPSISCVVPSHVR